MPAKSKEQQRLFGMVHAYQKGELKNPSKEVKDIAKSISYDDAEDFAETKHKGLPNKVKKSAKVSESKTNKNMKKNVVKLNENTLRQIVAESIKRVLKEDAYDFLEGRDFKWNNGYDSYVLVDDSCDAVIQNYTSADGYDAKADAINDAKKKAHETRGGSFSVFGCADGIYDEDSLVYCTSGDRNSWKF